MANIRPLSKELQAKAAAELNETPECLETDLSALKEWLLKTPHLKPRQDDQFLVSFLRGCKFSLERAKEKLDAFYTIRGAIPEFFANRKVTDDLLSYVKAGYLIPFPNLADPAGSRVMMIRASHDPNKYSLAEVYKTIAMIQDILMLEDDNLIISGSSYVVDMNQMTASHVQDLTPLLLKKSVTAWHLGNPFRLKGLEYINMPSFFATLLNVVKSLLPEKLKSRVFAYGDNYEGIYERIPKKLWPNEYGGEAGTLEKIGAVWAKKLEENRQFFEDDVNYGVDESKRVEKFKNAESLFGIDGTFRKLDVF